LPLSASTEISTKRSMSRSTYSDRFPRCHLDGPQRGSPSTWNGQGRPSSSPSRRTHACHGMPASLGWPMTRTLQAYLGHKISSTQRSTRHRSQDRFKDFRR
jgi:integrase